MFRVAIISVSDRGSRGERADLSTDIIQDIMVENRYEISNKFLIPDEYHMIKELLIDICDNNIADLVLTTGGTGFSPRDVTPDATDAVTEKKVPVFQKLLEHILCKLQKKLCYLVLLQELENKH